jgi:hypothetical protein
VVQEIRRLEIMRRDGTELMKGNMQRRQMHGRWMKRSGRIFGRLLEEVNGSLVRIGGSEKTKEEIKEGREGFQEKEGE